MNPALTIRTAYRNIRDNRLRSGLTILGLVIGIASVIILVGIGNGAANQVQDSVSSLGAEVLTVNITDSDKAMSQEQMEGLKDLVEDVTPYQMLGATLSLSGDTSEKARIVAVGEDYVSLMGYALASGRDLSKIDVDNTTKVAVIGSGLAEDFYGTSDPCGETIRINGDQYTVVGMLESTGSSMGNNVDDMLLVPFSVAKYLDGDTTVTSMYVKATDEKEASAAATAVEQYLAQVCGISDDYYQVSTQESMLEAMDDINNTLSLLLGGIAGISLLVGGIGVMNVMLVSVSERTREIGIRKSLGARRKDIMAQFLTESLVLSVLGGILGIIVGLAGGEAAVLLGASFAPGLTMILVAVIVSVAVGVVFGIMPSYRAACLRPVEALRYE